MCKLVMYNDLDVIQKANAELSLAWKKQSYDLIVCALKNMNKAQAEKDLIRAIIWCGEKGHAFYRHSKKTDSCAIVIKDWLLGLKDYNKVVFKEEVEFFVLKGIRYYSWISKICHILNPFDNPLCYDSRTRTYLKISGNYTKQLLDDWFEGIDAFKELNKDSLKQLDREGKYMEDSKIWAFNG